MFIKQIGLTRACTSGIICAKILQFLTKVCSCTWGAKYIYIYI